MRHPTITSIAAAAVLLVLTNTASADLYLKQKQTVGTDIKTIETWGTTDGYRINDGKTSLILPTESKRPLLLLHDKRAYRQYSQSIDDDPKLKQMKMIVAESPSTKKIGKWTCIKHTITVSSPDKVILRQKVWATEDIELSEANAALYKAYFLGPLAGRSKDFLSELEKVRGVEVLSVTQDFTDPTSKPQRTELIALDQKKAPGNILDTPAKSKQEIKK